MAILMARTTGCANDSKHPKRCAMGSFRVACHLLECVHINRMRLADKVYRQYTLTFDTTSTWRKRGGWGGSGDENMICAAPTNFRLHPDMHSFL